MRSYTNSYHTKFNATSHQRNRQLLYFSFHIPQDGKDQESRKAGTLTNGNPCTLLTGKCNCAAPVGNTTAAPQIQRLREWVLSPKPWQQGLEQGICPLMFTGTGFTTGRKVETAQTFTPVLDRNVHCLCVPANAEGGERRGLLQHG